jgi:hypothetical protein
MPKDIERPTITLADREELNGLFAEPEQLQVGRTASIASTKSESRGKLCIGRVATSRTSRKKQKKKAQQRKRITKR